MNYLITKTKRNNLIISSSIIILNYFFIGFSFLFKDARQLDSVENGVINLVFSFAYLYAFLFLLDYFKKNELKTLKTLTLIVLISELGSQISTSVNSFKLVIPEFLSSIFSGVGLIGVIIWIVLVLRLKSENYSELKSLHRFAYGYIASFVLGLLVSVSMMFGGFYEYLDLMYIPISIPFFFLIEFAVKLGLEQEKPVANTCS